MAHSKRYLLSYILMPLIVFLMWTTHVNAQHPGPENRGTLRSASELASPPFSIIREDGRLDGFAVELLREIARIQHLELSFHVGPWHEIRGALAEGNLDVLPLVSYSEERDKVFDFSAPYLQMHGAIFVRKGDKRIRNLKDLQDKEILVMRGDTAHEYAVQEKLSEHLILTEDFAEAVQRLSAGEHDALLVQSLVGLQLVKALGINNVAMVSLHADTKEPHSPMGSQLKGFEQKFCLAVKEGDTKLLALLNEGLVIVMTNGTYGRLYNKWFASIISDQQVSLKVILQRSLRFFLPLLLAMVFVALWYFRYQLRIKTLHLHREIQKHKETSQEMQGVSYSLEERLKELHCLYELYSVIAQQENPLEQIFQDVVELIPPAWQYPDLTWARFTTADQVYSSGQQVETKCCISRDIDVRGERYGFLEVFVVGDDCQINTSAFLPEEENLLNAIAERLSLTIERRHELLELQYATRIITNSSTIAFQWHNEEGWPVAYVSANVQKITGYTREDFLSLRISYADMIHEDDIERVGREVCSFSQSPSVDNFIHLPYRIITKNGDVRWVEDYTNIVRDKEGEIAFFEGVIKDITVRKEAEEALKNSEARLKKILATTGEGFWLVDNELTTIQVNQAMCTILGVGEADMVGRNALDFVGQANLDKVRSQIALREQGISSTYELTYIRPNGKEIPCLVNSTPFYDEAGQKIGSFALIADISAQREAAHRLEQAQQEAESASRLKSEFLATMSHEIRTPMNAIVGMTRLALERAHDLEQRRYLEIVKLSSDALLQLLNDILDFSKIETGQLHLEEQPFDLAHVMAAVKETLAMQVEEKDLEFSFIIPPQLHTHLIGDALRIRQVLLNLAGNALKFTEKGSIRIEVEELSQTPDKVILQFAVRDTGMGIPEEVQSVIFEKFSQADGTITKKFGGTGLGLAICKKIAALWGGKIWVESVLGKGSTFYFTCCLQRGGPVVMSDDKGETDVIAPPLPALHILLVEDNPFNRDLAQTVFVQEGHDVHCAEDGLEALERLSEDSYDVILMDVQMPGMDGIQSAQYIRLCEDNKAISTPEHQELLQRLRQKIAGTRTPIVAMTAFAMADDRRKCLTAGMDDYVTKPFVVEEVLQVIGRVI